MEEAWMEIEALRSIYEDELLVDDSDCNSIVVKKKVRPSDDEKMSSASVMVHFTLTEEYPEKSPAVALRNPRGLSEEDHALLEEEVRLRLEQNIGMPVVFDILQLCSDFLLEHQHADIPCPICLCPLDSEVFGTPCDHYIHKQCMREHTVHTRRQVGEKLHNLPPHMRSQVEKALLCPVCREVVEEEVEPIFPSPQKQGKGRRSGKERSVVEKTEEKFDFDWAKWRKERQRMEEMFEKQRQQGGIIDLEEERKKNLITEDTVIILPGSSSVAPSTEEPAPSSTSAEPSKPPKSSRPPQPRSERNRPSNPRSHHNNRQPPSSSTAEGEQKKSSAPRHHRGPRHRGQNHHQKPPLREPLTDSVA